MSGGIGSPSGRAAPLCFSPCLWGSWPFLLWSRQVGKLRLAAHWSTGRKEPWKIHTCRLLRWAPTREWRTREWTTRAVSGGPGCPLGSPASQAAEAPPSRRKSTASARGPTATWPQGLYQYPASQRAQTEIQRGGIGGCEYVMISTDSNSLSALCHSQDHKFRAGDGRSSLCTATDSLNPSKQHQVTEELTNPKGPGMSFARHKETWSMLGWNRNMAQPQDQ